MKSKITVKYGTWSLVEPTAPSLEWTVSQSLLGTDLSMSHAMVLEICTAYRAAINKALPERVNLIGQSFYGPGRLPFHEVDGYPLTEVGRVDIKAIVDGIDFWAIVEECESVLQ